MAIVDFTSDHIDGAAVLLAERYRRERQHVPALPARFEDSEETRAWVLEDLEQSGAEGVAAEQAGKVVGFLLGVVEMPSPRSVRSLADSPRAGHIVSHAVAPAQGEETYRHMYAAFAPRWLARGVFDHNVGIAATDAAALAAWYSLGFGQRSAHAMRDTAPPATVAPGLRIRRAVDGDVEAVFALVRGLFRHLAGAPTFEPYLPEAEPDVRRAVARWLAEDTPVWLAEREHVAVGTMVFSTGMPRGDAPARSVWLAEAFVNAEERGRGTGLGLLGAGLDEAHSAGYDWCLLNFLTANLAAARFWTHTAGFRPITYFLRRLIDDRIAWARPPK